MTQQTGYEYSRDWFDFAFDNPDRVRPVHTALYMWLVELKNRLGWPDKFGCPATQAMQACSVTYKTYKCALDDLVEFGFVDVVTESKNQHQSTIVALVKFTKPTTKAITKALLKQLPKQDQSNYQSNSHINKPINHKPKTINLFEQAWQEVDCKFGEQAQKLWADLSESPKWKKKTLNALCLSLKKIMEYEEAFAILLLEDAIANQYQGIVFANTAERYQKWRMQPQTLFAKPLPVSTYVPTERDTNY